MVYAIVFIGPIWFVWGSSFMQNINVLTIGLIGLTIGLGVMDWLIVCPIISSIEDGLSKGPTDYPWGKTAFEKIYTVIKIDFGKKRSDIYAGILSDIFVTSIDLNKALFSDFSMQTANGLFKLDYHWWVLSRIDQIFSGKTWDSNAELGFEYNWEWQFISPIWLNNDVAIKSMSLCDGGLVYIELEGDGLPNLPLKEGNSLIRDIEYLEIRNYEQT